MAGKAAVADRASVAEEPRRQPECQHHWTIDIAAGPVSIGICQICGTRKEFRNYLSDCLADKEKETYEGWLARQGQLERRRAKGRRGIMAATGED